MKTSNTINIRLSRRALIVLASLALAAGIHSARAQTLDFDSVPSNAGGVDGTAYLASFGITLSNVTGGPVDIINANDLGYVAATSPPNFLEQEGSTSGVSYTMNFSAPLSSVSFWRIQQTASNLVAQWSVTAYAGATDVGSVGEPITPAFGGEPAAFYTLSSGLGITSLTISGNAEGSAGNTSLEMDDLTLVAVPEPSTWAMMAMGGAALLILAHRRRARAV